MGKMDTSVKLTIQSEEQLVKLLGFLHLSAIPFDILEPDTFKRRLFQAIDGEKVNPSWMRNPVLEQQLDEIEQQLEESRSDVDSHDTDEHMFTVKEFRKLVKKEYTTAAMKNLYKPTEHFKEFCGSEWLTPKGMISPHSVLQFIDQHIQTRGIRVENGVVYMTEWMKSLLQESRDTLYYDELPQFAGKLLKIPTK